MFETLLRVDYISGMLTQLAENAEIRAFVGPDCTEAAICVITGILPPRKKTFPEADKKKGLLPNRLSKTLYLSI
jgi:hypothetical protein